MNCEGKSCSPLGQGFQESQGGQGCLEAHLPQGSPKEAKRLGQEGTLPQCPWFAGGAPTDYPSPEALTPQAPERCWGYSSGAGKLPR